MFYLLLFIAMCLAFRAGRVPMRVAAFAAVCLWGAYESFYGLLQIIGLEPSFNPAFVLTGHFENPGPFGGFIAMTMAVSGGYLLRFWRRRRGFYRAALFGVAALNFTLGLLVLPASMSRAAWFALAVSPAHGQEVAGVDPPSSCVVLLCGWSCSCRRWRGVHDEARFRPGALAHLAD